MTDFGKLNITKHKYCLHNPYSDSLRDVRWLIKRKEIIERDGEKCVICKSTEKLQVHHRQYYFYSRLNQYAKPWDYPEDVLITLCERCHKEGHKLYTIPVINI
ncbi:MAG: HNH endonuclease [Bacteroidales bacterium]|nr:HNH endonuclease [Bacteroidales bacterium]